jgi:hypothetical protein
MSGWKTDDAVCSANNDLATSNPWIYDWLAFVELHQLPPEFGIKACKRERQTCAHLEREAERMARSTPFADEGQSNRYWTCAR